ncbi:N-6 DNA methylase [Kitasatospora griseola]|uniref:N-6 DNA methylase n=1 Tax=Kitasatospora griseola TaxID=2064 RepID=A0A0D0Q4M5_KITGR|nr:N-6 DNA methylase [Kitasatospora griseola]KIQ65923.1 N-6 DNA methylase [Kitasatospora griseola]
MPDPAEFIDAHDTQPPTLVTGAEIARLAGVTRAAVSNWRRRYEDFPPAVAGSSSSPLFVWGAVQEWLRSRDRHRDVSVEVQVWQAVRAAYGDATVAAVAAAARYLARKDASVADAYDQVPHAVRDLLDRLADESDPGTALQALVDRMVDSARRTGSDQVTSPRVVRAVVHFAPQLQRGQTVFDPACGVGSLLLAMKPKRGIVRAGQDSDVDSVDILRARSALTGLKDVLLAHGNSLRADGHPGLAADLVLCDPPVAAGDWGRDELLLDPRWEFGTPSRAEGELAWLQHAYAHAGPGGRVLMVMPASVAYRKAGRRIRAELVRRGIVRQIVALPGGVASSHALPVHLWTLRRPEDGEVRPDTVRMIDLTGNDPDGSLDPIDAQVVDVPLVDLLDDSVDLTPAVHMPTARRDLADEYGQARSELVDALAVIRESLPELRRGDGVDLWDGATVAVADLVRAGLVEMRAGEPCAVGEQVNADYLDGFLRAGPNVRRSTSQSGSFRLDVKGARIPQRDPSVQRRYGAAFRALREVEREAERLAEAARRLAEIAREGLSSGDLEPGAG